MSKFRWLFAAGGAVLGILATTVTDNLQAPQAQGVPPRTRTKTCDVSPSFGAFEGARDEWLVVEDAAGALVRLTKRAEFAS